MLPGLESNGFMKKTCCGAQKPKTLCSPVPGSPLATVAVCGWCLGPPFYLSASNG